MRKRYFPTLCRVVFAQTLLFVLPVQAGTFKTLYNFAGGNDGIYPYGGPIFVGNEIYGSTFGGGPYSGQGTLYKFDPATEAETPIYYFGQNGTPSEPWGTLIYLNGSLWGTSRQGGVNGVGLGFQFNLQTDSETTLTTLCNPAPGLTVHKNLIYGAEGCGPYEGPFVYSIDPATDSLSIVADLYDSVYSLGVVSGTVTFLNDEIYGPVSGTTEYYLFKAGIFKANPRNGHSKIVYEHGGNNTGISVLTEYAGALYATRYSKNTSSGAVIRLDPATGVTTVIYKFTGGADGGEPASGVTAYNGLLYGETFSGGTMAAVRSFL